MIVNRVLVWSEDLPECALFLSGTSVQIQVILSRVGDHGVANKQYRCAQRPPEEDNNEPSARIAQ
jgi:hypothetical protein